MESCPGSETSISPPQVHIQVELSFKDGWFPTMIEEDPGDQGEVITGMQGAGVGVPIAAAVAAATKGLLCVLHIPKVGMFTMGT